MKKALINIDYTNDFVASDGSLTVGEPAQKLEKRITEISQEFLDAGEFVVFAIDTHRLNDPYHPETKLFPPHNIAGTHGQELYLSLIHISEPTRRTPISYAVFCLKKKKT